MYQKLFDLMSEEHGLTLTISEMTDIMVAAQYDESFTMGQLTARILTCRKNNTKEWMSGLVECINDYYRARGDDTPQFEFDGDMIAMIEDES